MALPNVWHLRTVADSASKSCYVCYKPTTGVLITPNNKDFFYVCRGHLEDRGFCSPIVDEAAVADKKKKEALDQEIELVKKEYEEKIKKKRDKANEKIKDQGQNGSKEQKQGGADEEKEAEKEKDEKINAATEKQKDATKGDMPRIYALHRNFYQMRLDKLRHAEIARRNRERLSNPSSFPAVPSGNP